jgi:hypothetical protein
LLPYLVTSQAALVIPALMVSGEGHHLVRVVARQTVLAPLHRVGYRDNLGDAARFVAHRTTVIVPIGVVFRRRGHLFRTVTSQTVLPALGGMGHLRDLKAVGHRSQQ